VPLDFSERSLRALEFVAPWLRRVGAEMHLVHVFEPDYPLASMAALPLVVQDSEVRRRVRRHLKDVAKKHSVRLRPENVHAVKGRPFEGICGLARMRDIDLSSPPPTDTPT
jgi:nucleotide-binding universal stress UspA family protein